MNLCHGFKNYFNHKSKKRIKEINKKKYDILIIDTQKDIQKSIIQSNPQEIHWFDIDTPN